MSIDWDLAGFQAEDGQMGRPVPAGLIKVPRNIWLKDDCIHWSKGEYRLREVSRSMLNQFLRLKDGPSVLHFAQEWGVLALSANLSTGWAEGVPFFLPGRQSIRGGNEPVSTWLYYSRRAQATLNVAAALRQGKLGDIRDWGEFAVVFDRSTQAKPCFELAPIERHTFGLGYSVILAKTPENALEQARAGIAREVNSWFNCWKKSSDGDNSDFALRWVNDRWDLQIDYHGLLFPAIAMQLALVLADASSLYTCSGCGLPYIRPRGKRRPKSGCANYCDQCSEDGVAQRRAVDAYRGKRAEALRLWSAGASQTEIADRLGTDVGRVSRWVEQGGKNGATKTRKR
jgi:hypothetical protein